MPGPRNQVKPIADGAWLSESNMPINATIPDYHHLVVVHVT
jgi:hypothetical protein